MDCRLSKPWPHMLQLCFIFHQHKEHFLPFEIVHSISLFALEKPVERGKTNFLALVWLSRHNPMHEQKSGTQKDEIHPEVLFLIISSTHLLWFSGLLERQDFKGKSNNEICFIKHVLYSQNYWQFTLNTVSNTINICNCSFILLKCCLT